MLSSSQPHEPHLTVLPESKETESLADYEDRAEKLTLAHKQLLEIPQAIVNGFNENVKYLDISHNRITNLDVLVYFKNLTSLIADGNPISEDCCLPPLPNLQLLWLNHCQIRLLCPWIRRLRESCPNLQYLCLMGNPAAPSYLNGGTFYQYLQYRLLVISVFPSLVHLDDRAVTEDQRSESQRLYKRSLLERVLRMPSRESGWSLHTLFSRKSQPNNLVI